MVAYGSSVPCLIQFIMCRRAGRMSFRLSPKGSGSSPRRVVCTLRTKYSAARNAKTPQSLERGSCLRDCRQKLTSGERVERDESELTVWLRFENTPSISDRPAILNVIVISFSIWLMRSSQVPPRESKV